MAKLGLFFSFVVLLLFGMSCGDDEKKESDTDPAETEKSDSVVGVGVDALTACTDFQVASWDRIRECDNPIAEILPANDQAGAICTVFCDTENKTVPQEDYDVCVTLVTTVDCDDLNNVSLDTDVASQIPEECSFLEDMLNCAFPDPSLSS